jgi:carbonic anhydrase/acetyltransferase-like protein (isoleucine patch superfamily)
MLLEHSGKRPIIHPSTYVAPTAVICGDVTIGENCQILFGSVLVAEGGPVVIGENCIVMENAVIRGTSTHATRIGDHVLVGPHSHLTGCAVDDCVFIATGVTVFNGAQVGARSDVRIGALVHLRTVLPADSVVPLGWVAVGDPAEILPPQDHARIWAIQQTLDFPGTIFHLKAAPEGETHMPELNRRYGAALAKHKSDIVVDE